MASSEQSPLLLPKRNNGNSIELEGSSRSADYEFSRRHRTVAVFATLIAMVMVEIFAIMKSSSVDAARSFPHPQDAADAKFLQEGRLKRSSIDEFIDAFAEESTMSFHTNLYKGSREKLPNLLYLNTTAAYEDLVTYGKSSALDFYEYVQGGWDAQINQGYCPVASAAAVLNSLRGNIELPQDPKYAPFPWATQFQVMNNTCVKENVVDVDDPRVVWVGLPLDMAAAILDCYLSTQGYSVQAIQIDPNKIDKYTTKKLIRDAVLDPEARVMINYDRGGIGQGDIGHGHFSPIGAYNYKKDAFLIMDVAKYKFPPVWVPSVNLYHGVDSVDNCGSFEYPQDERIITELKAMNPPNFSRWFEVLNCQPTYRGIIVVKPKK